MHLPQGFEVGHVPIKPNGRLFSNAGENVEENGIEVTSRLEVN